MAVTLESLKKSVGKKNSKSKIFAWLADLELAAGDLDTALQRVNGGLTLYPNDISAKLVRSKILFQKGDFEDCVHECESILVMDPFNLAAQKIMGDAYDQLGNIAERNLCYRRYHDMDPLNSFWKEEYDVVPEAAVGAAAVAGADEFSMPSEDDGALDLNLSEDSAEASESVEGLFDHPATASGEESLDGGLFEKSSEQDVENSIDKAFGEAFGSEAEDALEQEDSPFTKSLSESQFGDSLSSESASATASPFSSSFLDDVPEEQTSTAGQIDEPIASIDDDPFAALAAMLPNSDASEDAAIDELNASLDSVMDSIKSGETEEKPAEEFPADDNVSGDDVTAALSDMFGLDDDLEAEEAPAPKAADFGSIDIDEKAEENASKVFETSAAADKPQSVDDAFDSIFGEDELPEEKPVESA
ncbi:MAG: hypothetical protein MJY98_12445, partial [Fibrobacter sp.]|nr:hypothetical protein [Fibrobacter sp.]